MEQTPGSSPSQLTDRRGFLATAGAGGAALIAGCGAGRHAVAIADAPRVISAIRRSPAVRRGPQSLSDAVSGRVFTPGSPGYRTAADLYNPRFDGSHPLAVVRPRDAVDVRNTIRYTVDRGIPVRARSGGHSYAGYSTFDEGVVVDLRDLNQITVDRDAQTATVGAGAQLIDIYAALAAHGALLPGGSCPSVGISGVTLGGGFGPASRAFGLTADNLVGARIVTADGTLSNAEEDLLWALRGGGGGNFGVVTDFTFRIHPLPSVATAFEVQWPWSSAAEAIDAWQRTVPDAPAELGSTLHVISAGAPSIQASGQYLGSTDQLSGLLGPLLAVPGAQLTWLESMPYLALQYRWAGCGELSAAACHTTGAAPGGRLPRAAFRAKSDYVSRAVDGFGIAAMLAAAEADAGGGVLLCDAYGGRVAEPAPDATAFVHRDERFCIQYFSGSDSLAWVQQAWQKLRPYVSGFAYQNYIDPSLTTWRHAYYGDNHARLVATAQHVDPHHYFSFPQSIV